LLTVLQTLLQRIPLSHLELEEDGEMASSPRDGAVTRRAVAVVAREGVRASRKRKASDLFIFSSLIV
jgi:hypothetical protein